MSKFNSLAKQIADDLIRDQKKRVEHVVEYVAQRVSEDWEREARRVMDAYYVDYKSDLYDRTNELRNIIVPVNIRSGDVYTTGVEFDPSLMKHNLMTKKNSAFGGTGLSNRIGEEDIFKNFMYGAHGNENYSWTSGGTSFTGTRDIHFTSPSPMEMLDNYYKNYDSKFDRFWKEALLTV